MLIKKYLYINVLKHVDIFPECSDGAYGYGCVNNCSGHCMNDFPCNKQTGYCDRGCKPGYTDASCSKSKLKESPTIILFLKGI